MSFVGRYIIYCHVEMVINHDDISSMGPKELIDRFLQPRKGKLLRSSIVFCSWFHFNLNAAIEF